MLLHPVQRLIAASKARFKVIRAGRKGGKTALEVENIGHKAQVAAHKLKLTKTDFPTGRKVLYIAPTQMQARNIIWEALKNKFNGIGIPNEQQLQMKVPTEDTTPKGATIYATIYVGGWENRENYRGLTDVIHITFDEVDTLRNFYIGWLEIFRPMFLDTGGTADFIGTPKKENPNIRRLEKEAETKASWECFHFTSRDNPHLSVVEIDELEQEYKNDRQAYEQEVLAKHVENAGALFRYTSLVDMFTNTITKDVEKYLVIDIADDGSDKTVFSFWRGLELYRLEQFERLNTEGIVNQTREYAAQERIPYSQIAVDAIGVGAGVASSSLLDGIIGYKSSYAALKTDLDPTRLPNVHYLKTASLVSDYANLRSQCVFTLAGLVNEHQVACRVQDTTIKEHIIEELALYQGASKGDGKRMATPKDDIKALLGRSPDISDTLLMRMYFVIRGRLQPEQSQERAELTNKIMARMSHNERNMDMNSTQ